MNNNININLLPWRETKLKQKNLLFIVSYILSIIISILILIVIYFTQYISNNKIIRDNIYLQSEIQQLTAPLNEIEQLKIETENLQKQIEPLSKLFLEKMLFAKLLETIAYSIPEEVYLQKITLKKSTIEMLGVAKTDTQASDFIKNLSKFNFISNPTITQINAANSSASGDTDFRKFTISFEYNPLVEGSG